MMGKLLEENLREPVHRFFENKNYSVFDEVRLFQRGIDIIAKRRSTIIAVELKMRNWRRAVQQACLDLRVSNYAFIALPETIWSRIDRRIYYEAYNHGIGLLSVDGEARQIMRPDRSKRIQPSLRRSFLKRLQRIE